MPKAFWRHQRVPICNCDMPLDHYVSQVHLRNFYSPAFDGKKMRGFRKRDGLIFQCRSRDVCRVENGSTNEYLLHDRAIEEFLKQSRDAIYIISGFVACVSSCSPTAMRLGTDPLRNAVEATAKVLDAQGQIPRAPAALGGEAITDLLSAPARTHRSASPAGPPRRLRRDRDSGRPAHD